MHIDKYRIITINEGLDSGLFEKKYFCVDPEGLPFLLGNGFITYVQSHTWAEQTPINYMNDTFILLNYFYYQNPSFSYLSPTDEVRKKIKVFIQKESGWHTKPHRNGNFIIKTSEIDQITGENLSRIKLSTLHNRIISWKIFYEFLIENHHYEFENPLKWTIPNPKNPARFAPVMPPKSGMTLPQRKNYWGVDTFFCVVDGEWQPRFIDDPDLPTKLLTQTMDTTTKIILRILFEGGPRIHEVLFLSIGDWRKMNKQVIGIQAISKGSHHDKVKMIHWGQITQRMISHYINNERRILDKRRRAEEDLSDYEPLFLNHRGNRVSRIGFYKNFKRICENANTHLTVHQIRHWFVTSKLRRIYNFVEKKERESYKEKFRLYMGWSSKETITIYDHFLGQINDEELYEIFDREYMPKNTEINQNKLQNELKPEAIERNRQFLKFLNQDF